MDRKENVGRDDKATIRLTADRGDCMLDPGDVMHPRRTHFNADRWRLNFGRAEKTQSTTGGRRRVEHDGDSRETRRDLLEQLNPLSTQRGQYTAEPSDVPAGVRQAVDEAVTDGIRHLYEHNRNGASLAH